MLHSFQKYLCYILVFIISTFVACYYWETHLVCSVIFKHWLYRRSLYRRFDCTHLKSMLPFRSYKFNDIEERLNYWPTLQWWKLLCQVSCVPLNGQLQPVDVLVWITLDKLTGHLRANLCGAMYTWAHESERLAHSNKPCWGWVALANVLRTVQQQWNSIVV